MQTQSPPGQRGPSQNGLYRALCQLPGKRVGHHRDRRRLMAASKPPPPRRVEPDPPPEPDSADEPIRDPRQPGYPSPDVPHPDPPLPEKA